MLERLQLFNSNRPLDVFLHWDREGCLILDAPYQRGDVWGPIRRVNLIRSLLLQIPIPSIIINDRGRRHKSDDFGYAVIDGKQRITSMLMFLKSQLAVPGEWFDVDKPTVVFNELAIGIQRSVRNRCVSCSEGVLESIEEERMVFELVNFGGVPQGQSDV